VRLITGDGHELTSDKDEMTEAMLAIGAVFAGLEKKRLVKKLRSARDRMRSEARGERIEGRPALAPLHQRFPEAVAMAKRLYRANPKSGERRSLREISAEREKAGHVMMSKYRKQLQPRAFNPATIKAMIRGQCLQGATPAMPRVRTRPMADRTPLSDQLDTIERLLDRAKAEQDWRTIPALKSTADLIRWTMANTEALKVAVAVVRDPAVQAVLSAFPGSEIKAIRAPK
jgi:hypothetical protein